MIFAIIFIAFICAISVKLFFYDSFSKFVGYSFIIYWFGSLALSTFRPLGQYEISAIAYILLLCGGFFFVLGMLLAGNRAYVQIDTRDKIERYTEKILTNKIFLLFIALLTLYFLTYLKEALLYSQMTEI